MPDPRPLPSLRSGAYDDPPASSEASTPQTRRQRLRRAILGTNELAQEVIHMANSERQGRRSTVGGLRRRRERSSSEHDELSTGTPEGEGRRIWRSNKRRRLNLGAEPATRRAIKYGYYGQVEPGRLQLELISCDGGQHIDARHPETSLGPENLLRHDKSVYCSERPQSNVVLKHADDTAFCLEKLHVVGPEMGFTAPVRAGIVYVAMTMGELQRYVDEEADPRGAGVPPHARRSRVSPYRRQPRRREERGGWNSSALLTMAEALRVPYINAAHSSLPAESERERENDFEDGDPDYDLDAYCETDPNGWIYETQPDPSARRTQPVTILSDEDAGPEESSPQEVLDYRRQREWLMRRRNEIENWHRSRVEAGTASGRETSEYPYSPVSPRLERLRERDRERERITTEPLSRLLMRQRDRELYRPHSPSEEDQESNPPTPPAQPEAERPSQPQPRSPIGSESECYTAGLPFSNLAKHSINVDGVNGELKDRPDENVTIAPFRLARGKHKVAIKFDPPVSGRFIMLKLWSADDKDDPTGRDRDVSEMNVDVQSVVAKGWMGGMRFFPAVEMK